MTLFSFDMDKKPVSLDYIYTDDLTKLQCLIPDQKPVRINQELFSSS